MSRAEIEIRDNESVFSILSKASKALIKNGKKEEVDELYQRLIGSSSYKEFLKVLSKYVNIIKI